MSPTELLKAKACEMIEELRPQIDSHRVKRLVLELSRHKPGQIIPDGKLTPEFLFRGDG